MLKSGCDAPPSKPKAHSWLCTFAGKRKAEGDLLCNKFLMMAIPQWSAMGPHPVAT